MGVVVVQSFSHVRLFATPRTVAWQASLSFTISRSLLKFISIESRMPANHFILCHTLSLQSVPMSCLFVPGAQSIGASTSASVLPMNIQDWFPLGFIGLISLQSKGISRFFNTTVRKHQFFGTQPSLWSNSYNHAPWMEKP